MMGDGLAGQVDPQRQRQRRALSRAFRHAKDELLEQGCGAVDQVDMTGGDRIEGARVDSDSVSGRSQSKVMQWRRNPDWPARPAV
jgi:hypothetical protein